MKCCLCHSDEKEKLYKLCSNMKVLGKHFPECDSYVSVCKKCGLVYMDMEATKEDFDKYYAELSNAIDYVTLHGKEGANNYFKHMYDCVKEYVKPNSKIIDIAGAKGEFAEYLNNLDVPVEADVIEYSKQCVDGCKERGVSVIQTDCYQKQPELEKKYDIAFLNHTLEHFTDVAAVVENALYMLKENGILFIEVPDIEGYANYDEVPYFYLTYEHITHMSKITLENISKIYGLKLLKMDKYLKGNGKNGGVYPSIYAVYQKGGQVEPFIYDTIGQTMIEKYLEKCHKEIHSTMEEYRRSNEPLILWGVGASTAQLLSSAMDGCNIVALVDSNPNRQGIVYQINGQTLTIISPDMAKERGQEDTILILPVMYKDAIQKQIREMGFQNKIVALSQREL